MLLAASLQIIFPLFLQSSATVQAEDECLSECFCSPSPLQCPPGVSWVTDSCGCCKICSRQFNQECSATEPCDHIKGLRCHLGAGGDSNRGLCRGEKACFRVDCRLWGKTDVVGDNSTCSSEEQGKEDGERWGTYF